MKNIFLIALLLYTFKSYAKHGDKINSCTIKLPAFIYYSSNIDEKHFVEELDKLSNCKTSTLKKISKTLRGVNGAVPTEYLKKRMLSRQVKILSKSKFITIDLVKNLLAAELKKQVDPKIKEIKHDIENEIIILNYKPSVVFQKNLQGDILNSKNVPLIKFKFDHIRKINTLVASETIYPYSNRFSLNRNVFFSPKDVWASKESEYVKQNISIDDYSPVRIVNKGTALMLSDIKKRTVIRTGNVTPVVLMNNGLTIKTTGMAKNSGKLGEFIEVKLRNNKVVRGIVQKGLEYYVKI